MKTLKDVALCAGVSIATVSRVLGGNYPVTERTRQRVLKAIEELDYHPDGVARSLRSAKTYILGILVPDLANPYFMQLVRAVEETVAAFGYHLLVASSNENGQQETDLLRIFVEQRVDGVVMAPATLEPNAVLTSLAERHTPVVLVDRRISGMALDSVREEGRAASEKLVHYVISQGHRKIGLVVRRGRITSAVEREEGFRKAMVASDLAVQEDLVIRGEYDRETGYRAGKQFLTMGEDTPTAVFCANNLITLGLMHAIYEVGQRVPDDVSVVSFGDPFEARFISPQITAVVQNPVEVGIHAARILLRKLQEGGPQATKPEDIVLPTSIRLGDSVGRPHAVSRH